MSEQDTFNRQIAFKSLSPASIPATMAQISGGRNGIPYTEGSATEVFPDFTTLLTYVNDLLSVHLSQSLSRQFLCPFEVFWTCQPLELHSTRLGGGGAHLAITIGQIINSESLNVDRDEGDEQYCLRVSSRHSQNLHPRFLCSIISPVEV